MATTFGVAFTAGAVLTFGAAAAAGAWLSASAAPSLRYAAAVALLALVSVDVAAARAKRYCGLGLRRQTPKALAYTLPPLATIAVWAFDTGLAVTTFRVASLTWGALLLTLLGFSTWHAGLAYGVGFALPLSVLLLPKLTTRRLDALASMRPFVQGASAVILSALSVVLLIQ